CRELTPSRLTFPPFPSVMSPQSLKIGSLYLIILPMMEIDQSVSSYGQLMSFEKILKGIKL
ncbi:hypothetical protein OAO50_03835, partial [Paracoccaceae bacterium]|nr:hypothetical protein [Paracoccaceae bacterium]